MDPYEIARISDALALLGQSRLLQAWSLVAMGDSLRERRREHLVQDSRIKQGFLCNNEEMKMCVSTR